LAQQERGLDWFKTFVFFGLKPHDVCIDYGCGSLRVGQHLIAYLEPGHYWGLDITDRFFKDGLDLLPVGLIEGRRPNIRVIAEDSLREAAAAEADFVVSTLVLSHIHPGELGIYFDRTLGLMCEKTTALISFRETLTPIRTSGASWTRDADTLERLIRERRPQSSIRFHRRAKRKRIAGIPEWKTILEISSK